MTYGFDTATLVVWVDAFDRVLTDRTGVLCRRHADAMVVPLGWMLDDRRDPIPRLFKAPAQPTSDVPRQRRSHTLHGGDAEQLTLGADAVVAEFEDVDTVDDEMAVAVTEPVESEGLSWKPTFDQTDDLDGLLEARSPLLARAFGGHERRRPSG